MWPIPHSAPCNPINAAALSAIYVKAGVQRKMKIPLVKIPVVMFLGHNWHLQAVHSVPMKTRKLHLLMFESSLIPTM